MSNLLKYDVIYILDPNSTTEEQTAVASKVEQVVSEAKGTVLKKDDWGKRRLAYLVAKHREGHYIFFHVSVTPDTVAEITRNLRLMEKVIKFSIVKDTISHLKPKPRPVRTSVPGAVRAPGSAPTAPPRTSTAPSAPTAPASEAPAAPTAPAPAPTNP